MGRKRKDPKEIDKLTTCTIYNHCSNMSEDILEKKLNKLRDTGKILSYCYVRHDRDKYTYADQEKNSNYVAGTLKTAHYHIWLKLPRDKARMRKDIAKWLEVGWTMVQDLEYQFENSIVYATHALHIEKAQYGIDEVVCSGDINYAELVQKRVKEYQEATRKSLLVQREAEIMEAIECGKINKFNINRMITAQEEKQHKQAINIALERYERDMQQRTDRNMTCLYINGASRACKTSLAKRICEDLKLTYCIAGAKDPMQYYIGQQALIIDDVSIDTFKWKEFLNLTDNDTATPVASRFKNKMLFCDLLIITANLEPYQLVNQIYQEGEDKNQFFRRFKQYYKVDYSYITEYEFDDNINVMKYKQVGKMTNYAVPLMAKKQSEKEEKRLHICLADIMERWIKEENIIVLDTVKYEPKVKKKKENKEVDLVKMANNSDDFDSTFDNSDNDFFG